MQVFIFVTIAKFGALTCSIIGLSRKITTLLASIYFYGHHLNGIQVSGLVISVTAMVMNFMGKSKKGGHGHHTQHTKDEKEHEDEVKKEAERQHTSEKVIESGVKVSEAKKDLKESEEDYKKAKEIVKKAELKLETSYSKKNV